MTGKVRGGKQRKGTKVGLVKESKWHERLSNFDVGPFSLSRIGDGGGTTTSSEGREGRALLLFQETVSKQSTRDRERAGERAGQP